MKAITKTQGTKILKLLRNVQIRLDDCESCPLKLPCDFMFENNENTSEDRVENICDLLLSIAQEKPNDKNDKLKLSDFKVIT